MRVIEDTEYAKLSPEERRAYESQLKQFRDYHNQLAYREELAVLYFAPDYLLLQKRINSSPYSARSKCSCFVNRRV